MADFTFAIVSWNTRDLLESCLRSLEAESMDFDVQILVADNASGDGSADMVADHFPSVTLIRNDRNLGFAAAHAALFPLSRGRYHVLVNSDVELLPGCLTAVDARMQEDDRIGILGPQILETTGDIQPSCRRFPTLSNQFVDALGVGRLFPRSRVFNSYMMGDFDHRTPSPVDQVMGSFFVIRRTLLDEIGYLDIRFFMYYEEVDYCLRAHRGGYSVFFEPGAQVRHVGGASARQVRALSIRRKSRSMYHYFRKHHGRWSYAPLLLISAMDGVLHGIHALLTGRDTIRTIRGYWLGFWDIVTCRPASEDAYGANRNIN